MNVTIRIKKAKTTIYTSFLQTAINCTQTTNIRNNIAVLNLSELLWKKNDPKLYELQLLAIICQILCHTLLSVLSL